MGAARVLEQASWTQVATGATARRPSWLAPAPKSNRRGSLAPPKLSIVPRPMTDEEREAEAQAQAQADAKEKADADAAENARRVAELGALHAEIEDLKGTAAGLALELATARTRILEASVGELVGLAMAIARRVVGDALSADPSQITAWAKEAMASLPAREKVIVVISADLAESIDQSAWDTVTSADRLEVDATLPPRTCELRAGEASVEVGVEARLDAVAEAIGASS